MTATGSSSSTRPARHQPPAGRAGLPERRAHPGHHGRPGRPGPDQAGPRVPDPGRGRAPVPGAGPRCSVSPYLWRSFVRFSRCHTDRMPRRAVTDGSGPEPSATLRSRHVEATRRAVLGAARSLFGQKGYAQTSVDEIAAAALVTKGAVYHHFADKKALFRAVYSEVEAEAQARTAEAIDPAGSAIDQIVAGVSAYLDVALDRARPRTRGPGRPAAGLRVPPVEPGHGDRARPDHRPGPRGARSPHRRPGAAGRPAHRARQRSRRDTGGTQPGARRDAARPGTRRRLSLAAPGLSGCRPAGRCDSGHGP